MPILANLFQVVKFLLWDNLNYFVIVVVFGWLLWVIWGRAQKRAEQGMNGLWHLVLSWVYFGLEILTVIALIAIIARGSVLLYSYTRDQLHAGAVDAVKAGGFDVTSTPGAITLLGTQLFVPTLEPFFPTSTPAPSYTATPQANQQGFAYTGTMYVVDYQSGSATLRNACTQDAPVLGEIPNGTQVNVIAMVNANCVNNICLRGQISPLVGFPSGGCLHMAAVRKP